MNANHLFRQLGLAVLGIAGGLLAVHGAVAGDVTETAVVTTSSGVPTVTVVGRSDRGRPIVLTEIRHVVRFSDLNLATRAGADVLRGRVNDAALKGCRTLYRMSLDSGSRYDCVHDAVTEAQPVMEAVISEARMKAKPGSA
jgi:UrcA family protein